MRKIADNLWTTSRGIMIQGFRNGSFKVWNPNSTDRALLFKRHDDSQGFNHAWKYAVNAAAELSA